MTSAMKLLCIIEATTVTGPAKNLLSFCRLMRARKAGANGLPHLDVSIVTFDRVSEASENLPNAFVAAAREAGVTIDVIPERFRFDPKVIKQLNEIVAHRAPDIIQTHMIKSHFLVKLSGLMKKYPWVAYHHGYTTTDLKMRVYNQLNRWSLPSATRVITVCEAFANRLSRTRVGPDRIKVCHNSVVAPREVSVDERQALRRKLGIAGDELVMLAVGRLSLEKGHHDLVKATAMLRDLDPSAKFKLVIVGDGPERESLTQAVTQQDLDRQILFIGHVGDVAPFYAIADVLALTSHSEGSPNVLLEAMSAGIPAVATAVGGVPEIAIAEENALIVPARDPQRFASALHRVLSDPELRRTLGENARRHVVDHFSPASYADSLVKIYQELLPKFVSGPGAVAPGPSTQGSFHDPVAIPTRRDSESLSA